MTMFLIETLSFSALARYSLSFGPCFVDIAFEIASALRPAKSDPITPIAKGAIPPVAIPKVAKPIVAGNDPTPTRTPASFLFNSLL